MPICSWYPGSFQKGCSTRMSAWMETKTCSSVLTAGFHSSPRVPCHVFSSDRHTLPSAYRLGLKRTRLPPVVWMSTCGGLVG